MPCRLKGAGCLINPEYDDTVAALVGNEAELAGRIYVEVPGCFDIGCFMLYESQFPIC